MGLLDAYQPGDDAGLRQILGKIGTLRRDLDELSASVGKFGAIYSQSGITIRDGGTITGEGGGALDWSGDADFGGTLDVTGAATIGGTLNVTGDATFSGDTTLGGNLTFGNDTIPPEALSSRAEAKTFTVGNDGAGGMVTSRTISLTVTAPAWATATSCMAWGVSSLAIAPVRGVSHITIDGNQGTTMEGGADFSLNVSAVHARDLTGNANFTVALFSGVQGIDPASIAQTLIVQAVFTR
ncbi:hypothetical protein ACOCHS_06240 [Propionibacteriaceae bacterium Y2011]